MKQQGKAAYYQELMKIARGGWKPQDYSQHLLIPDNRIMVLADVHLPRHDEKFLAQAFEHAYNVGIESIVFLGDLMDNPTWSKWGVEDWSDNYERELTICQAIVRCAADAVPHVYWSYGNHEARVLRDLKAQIKMRHLALLCELQDLMDQGRLIVSDDPTLEAFGGTWMLTHPSAYGPQPLVKPGLIATRFEKHIISAHAHHYASGLDQTGRFQVIESGGLFKPEYFKYIQHRVTPHRAWVQGYWILDDGMPTGYRPTTSVMKRTGKTLLERLSA
ncbi:MAG: metallophosphoesterase [Patescibacteria group bacterium]|nr:metallophosphoesterase [Patescibacteria group bacterium]